MKRHILVDLDAIDLAEKFPLEHPMEIVHPSPQQWKSGGCFPFKPGTGTFER